jgi:hypothetical protein
MSYVHETKRFFYGTFTFSCVILSPVKNLARDSGGLQMNKQNESQNKQDESRRQFIKTAAYIAPAILTLAVAPSFAKPGSTKEKPPEPPKPPKPPKLPK